jgi:hypothetical protein
MTLSDLAPLALLGAIALAAGAVSLGLKIAAKVITALIICKVLDSQSNK